MTGGRTAFLWNDDFLRYQFGPSHPFQPVRERMTLDLLRERDVFDGSASIVEGRLATDDEVLMVHTQEHVDFVRARTESGHGLLDAGDTPATRGLFEGSMAAVGATVQAADLISTGEFVHAFNSAGGLHHAHPDHSSGFCVFNDVAIGVRALQRRHGFERIAVVDIDGHHGDGTQSIFYREKVLTISAHRYGHGFFPGSGSAREIGEGEGKGYAINLPVPAFTGDDTYLRAFKRVVLPALEAYRPQVIVHQFGVDAHLGDPLVGLGLTTRAYLEVAGLIHDASHRLCDGRYLILGGGGYDLDATSRVWALMFCRISGALNEGDTRCLDLHDGPADPEPADVAETVDETADYLVREVLPLIR
jgi:acetoin utilization protein AcuC